MFDFDSDLLLPLIDLYPDCSLCDASTYRNAQDMVMTECVGDITPHIVYVADPASQYGALSGEPVDDSEMQFIRCINEAASVDYKSVHGENLRFAVVPVVGCPAAALREYDLDRSQVRCHGRVRSYIEQLDPLLIVALHKESFPIVAMQGKTLQISGMYAHSKLSFKDSEARTTSDVLKIRQMICSLLSIPFVERVRSSTTFTSFR